MQKQIDGTMGILVTGLLLISLALVVSLVGTGCMSVKKHQRQIKAAEEAVAMNAQKECAARVTDAENRGWKSGRDAVLSHIKKMVAESSVSDVLDFWVETRADRAKPTTRDDYREIGFDALNRAKKAPKK